MRAFPPRKLTADRSLPLGCAPVTTGRTLVLLREGPEAVAACARTLHAIAGLCVDDGSSLDHHALLAELPPSSAVVLDRVGVAVVNGDPDQIGRLCVHAPRCDVLLAVEPERVLRVAAAEALQDASRAMNGAKSWGAADSASNDGPHACSTWGLRASGVLMSCRTGEGVRLASLSTGVDLAQCDFSNRRIISRSFLADPSPHDGHGHGTQALAIAGGKSGLTGSTRYAIASDCEVFVGKVMNDQGFGTDGAVLAGIAWSLAQRCQIVLLPLSAAIRRGVAPSLVFEVVARRALAAGALLIAAAGDHSDRAAKPTVLAPVAHPANCPSIMAVTAIERWGHVARYANRALAPGRAWIDIAAHDWNVELLRCDSRNETALELSSLSGTGAAAAHLAGLAALHAQANPGIAAFDLWTRLLKTALPLDLPAKDVGAGLGQAPA